MRWVLVACLLFYSTVSSASENFSRIVVLMPHLAESLFNFGILEEIVGVPEFTTVPESQKKRIKFIGPYHRISIESVLALRPTIVLASKDGNLLSNVDELTALGINVKTFDPRTLGGVVATLVSLREIADQVRPKLKLQNERKLLDFKKQLTKLRGSLPNARVFVQIGFDPLVTVSDRSFLGEFIHHLGLENIYAKELAAYPRPAIEDVVSRRPDIILIVNLTNSAQVGEKNRAVWAKFRSLPGVSNDRVIMLAGDRIVKPGFEMLQGAGDLVTQLKRNNGK